MAVAHSYSCVFFFGVVTAAFLSVLLSQNSHSEHYFSRTAAWRYRYRYRHGVDGEQATPNGNKRQGGATTATKIVEIMEGNQYKYQHEHEATDPNRSGPKSQSSSETRVIEFSCPEMPPEKSLNDKSDKMEIYEKDNRPKQNLTLEELRDTRLYGWFVAPTRLKELIKPWKVEVFVENLRSGDSIYESACGNGMNLLMTTEILKEHNIHPIHVYGNDYVQSSVSIANRDDIWTETAHKGLFCTGDSSKLDFVPSSSFDLVFTGYIDPILDVLNLLPPTSSSSEKGRLSVYNCHSNITLAKLEQSKQEDWYASWVSEMVRIVKPGKVVAIESNAEPVCQAKMWGGVARDWWKKAVIKYGWDVDPDSIVIRDMPTTGTTTTRNRKSRIRYHVMMRRNKASIGSR